MSVSVNGRQNEETNPGMNKFKQLLRADNPKMIAFLRRQGGFMAFVVLLLFVWIGNRYASQREVVHLEHLQKELVDEQYQALSVTSEVSAKSKPSYVGNTVRKYGMKLEVASKSPYRIEKK